MTRFAESPVAAGPVALDSLGCSPKHLDKNGVLSGRSVTFHRKKGSPQKLNRVSTPPAERGLLIGVSLEGGHRRRIYHGHHATDHLMGSDDIYIRSFSDAYTADLSGSFNFILMELQPEAFRQLAVDGADAVVPALRYTAAHHDAVTASLAKALEPAFDRPDEVSELFLDQLSITIGTHLLQSYGAAPAAAKPRGRVLSRSHERIAKDIIRSQLTGALSVAEIAAACNLSRGYFSYAFRETTGQTPHQWLITQRLERAYDLLRDATLSLSDIALDCGFADQSHFTRVFSKIVGISPGKWRIEIIS